MSSSKRDYSPGGEPVAQHTELFSRESLGIPLPVQKTVVIEPVRLEPQAASDTRTRTVLLTSGHPATAPKFSPDSAPSWSELAQDTVEIAPFWLREPTLDGATNAAPARPSLETTRTENVPVAKPSGASDPSNSRANTEIAPAARAHSPGGAKPALLAPKSIAPTETTYFEPIQVPKQHLAVTSAAVPPPSNVLTRLGKQSRQKPVRVWVGGALLAFAFSAAVSFGIRRLGDTPQPREHARVAEATPPSETVPTKTIATPNETKAPTSEPVTHLASRPIEVTAPVPQPTASTPPKKGQLFDPALSTAVGHLIAGRHGDAQRSYQGVASRVPADPALAAAAKLLGRKLSSNCTGSVPNPTIACPEVKP